MGVTKCVEYRVECDYCGEHDGCGWINRKQAIEGAIGSGFKLVKVRWYEKSTNNWHNQKWLCGACQETGVQ